MKLEELKCAYQSLFKLENIFPFTVLYTEDKICWYKNYLMDSSNVAIRLSSSPIHITSRLDEQIVSQKSSSQTDK
jgi:hypothetical protein